MEDDPRPQLAVLAPVMSYTQKTKMENKYFDKILAEVTVLAQ